VTDLEALMTDAGVDPAVTIRQLVDGYQVSQAVHVVAALGIADLLVDGARSCDDLAAETGTHPPSLYRLLRALASVDVFHEADDRHFELTPLGQRLRVDVEDSIAGWAVHIGQPYYWSAWSALGHAVRTGDNAFRYVHGTDVWTYRSTRRHESAVFDEAMSSLSRRTNAQILAAYDFSRFSTIVDVGGGTGAFLGAVLAAEPSAHGVLFDQPHVLSGAPAVLERLGVACGSWKCCEGRCPTTGHLSWSNESSPHRIRDAWPSSLTSTCLSRPEVESAQQPSTPSCTKVPVSSSPGCCRQAYTVASRGTRRRRKPHLTDVSDNHVR
jgi:hypothetical protein